MVENVAETSACFNMKVLYKVRCRQTDVSVDYDLYHLFSSPSSSVYQGLETSSPESAWITELRR